MNKRKQTPKPAKCMKTEDRREYRGHIESNSGDECVFYHTVRFNRGDYCRLQGWAELNRGDYCVLDGVVELNRGDYCKIVGHCKVNYGDYCTVEKGGSVGVDVGYATNGAEVVWESPPPDEQPQQQQQQQQEGDMECLVCMDEKKVMMFSRCHHLAVCEECGGLLKKDGNFCCPLCRAVSPQLIRVHY